MAVRETTGFDLELIDKLDRKEFAFAVDHAMRTHALAEQEAFDLLVTLTDPLLAPAMAGALLAFASNKPACPWMIVNMLLKS